jgi:hypothetical protein
MSPPLRDPQVTTMIFGKIFEVDDPGLREAMHQLIYQLEAAQQTAATLSLRIHNRKLSHFVNVQRASMMATFMDDGDKALDDLSKAATKYLARRAHSPLDHKKSKDLAADMLRELTNAPRGLELVKDDHVVRTWSPPSRWQVAEWLAWRLRGHYAEVDATAIYEQMPLGRGRDVDPIGIARDEPFACDPKKAIAAAFKALGQKGDADKLFAKPRARTKQPRARTKKKRRARRKR